MACQEEITTCITQGNDWYLDVTVTVDGVVVDGIPSTPKNLTGASCVLTFKESKTGAVVSTPTVDIFDPVNGRVSFTLTAAQTETLITSGDDSRRLFGAPQITYQDGTVDDLFIIEADIHESWN